MIRKFFVLVSAALFAVNTAHAAPSVGEKVYGATFEAGKSEL